jgi:hypothetical protein
MRLNLLRSKSSEIEVRNASFHAVMDHLAASRASKESLAPSIVRNRVTQDSLQAMRERLSSV